MVMPGIPGYDADYNPYPYDVAAAKTHMTTALAALGVKDTDGDGNVTPKDLGPMKFGYNCNAGHLPRVAFLAEAWRTGLGFGETQFDISCSDFATFLQERPAGKYNISRDGWGADFPHAKNQLDLLVCGSGNNNSQYCNPAFDAAFNQAATIADPAQQAAKYIEAQRIAVDDASVLFLRFGLTRYLVRPYVGGLTPSSSDHRTSATSSSRRSRSSSTDRPPGISECVWAGRWPAHTFSVKLCNLRSRSRRVEVIGFIVRRVLWLIPVLFVVSLITFALMHAVPGGPWDREKPLDARTVAAALNAIYGLEQARSGEQYIHWVGGMLQRDFGPSYQYRDRGVNDILADGLAHHRPAGLMAFVVAIVVGIPLGHLRRARPQPLARLRRHGRLDGRHRDPKLRPGDPADRRLQRRG